MNSVFADTFYFLAFLNPNDPAHQTAVEFSRKSRTRLITTAWVLGELADGLSRSVLRRSYRSFLQVVEASPNNEIVWWDPALFRRAVVLYDARPDKHWSLTDCISFAVMQERNITDALTADHHFEQAGFVALLK